MKDPPDFGDAEFEDISDRVAQLALQGPKANGDPQETGKRRRI